MHQNTPSVTVDTEPIITADEPDINLQLQDMLDIYLQAGNRMPTMLPLLPIFLHLRGEPYTLENHFVMEPLFSTNMPWRMLWKCGRQVAKSTSLSAQGVIQSATQKYFNTLFVLPLYEMTKRLSSNYVRPFIEHSPIRPFMVRPNLEQSVLQKSFRNQSTMFFTFAFLDCERVRGISGDKLVMDEVQDMDWDFIPIIAETLSASKWGIQQYSGTPKSFDNTIQTLWDDSSQAEWIIKCKHCNHYNIPSISFDILDMIGPWENIAKYGSAVICAKCGKSVNPREGCWVHAYADKRTEFSGYHVPQIIMPMHYEDERKWMELLRKKNKSIAPAAFMNECLGESSDVGTKLISQEELKTVAVLHKNTMDAATKCGFRDKYIQRTIGVDWGGGGLKEVSYTTIAVVGLRPDYKHELIYCERLHAATDDMEEVRRVIKLYTTFSCTWLAHDFGGSGSVHETLLIQALFPPDRLIPFVYVRASASNMITHHPPTNMSNRHYWSLDKTRSLILLCTIIKTGHLLFTEWESSKDLLEDFLNLIEDKVATKHAGDIFTVTKNPKRSDDVAHAVNYACCAHYHSTQRFPDIAHSFGLTMTKDQLNVAQPPQV